MKDKYLNIKVAQSFKDRLRKGADYLGVNITMFTVMAINEKLEKLEIKKDGE